MKLDKKNKILELDDFKWNNYVISFLRFNNINATIKQDKIHINTNKIGYLSEQLKDSNNLLNYNITLKLLDDLGSQLIYLERNNYTFNSLELDDILVINNNIFLLINTNHFSQLDDNKYIIEQEDISKLKFLSPEMKNKIPITIKSNYYLIANILIYCLFNINITNKSEEEIFKILEPIYNIKLYWFLLRCLTNEIENRYFIYI